MKILKNYKHLVKILIVELMLTVIGCSICVNIFQVNAYELACKNIANELVNIDTELITGTTNNSIKLAKEKIIVKTNDDIWVTDNVNYRKGPGTNYDVVGTLDKYTKIKRIGTTSNGWSQVKIDDKKYYIINDYITTKQPAIAEIESGKKGEYQLYALSILSDYGWADSEIVPLIKLWNRESHWNPSAHNKHSGAHGIPQALPGRKMASEGSDWATNGKTQIRWGLNYIKNRYGSPSKAWSHSESHGWY